MRPIFFGLRLPPCQYPFGASRNRNADTIILGNCVVDSVTGCLCECVGMRSLDEHLYTNLNSYLYVYAGKYLNALLGMFLSTFEHVFEQV